MIGRGKRGFASMDQEKQRRIASLGGKAAHRKGTAHEFTSEEAREAGRKGRRAVQQNETARHLQQEAAREVRPNGNQREHAGEHPAGMPVVEASTEMGHVQEAEFQSPSQAYEEQG